MSRLPPPLHCAFVPHVVTPRTRTHEPRDGLVRHRFDDPGVPGEMGEMEMVISMIWQRNAVCIFRDRRERCLEITAFVKGAVRIK